MINIRMKTKPFSKNLELASKRKHEKCKFEYESNLRYCKQCNIPLSYTNRKNIFCSSSCSATFNNKCHSVESRKRRGEKISKTMKQRKIRPTVGFRLKNQVAIYTKVSQCQNCFLWFEGWYRKTCSQKCRFEYCSRQQSKRLSNPEYRRIHQYGRGKRSWLETSFETWLIHHNVTNFRIEEKFFNPLLHKYYFVDFLFPDKKLIIELDGTQHNQTKQSDSVRDQYFQSIGYTVLRITHKEYQQQTRINEIKKLINLL